MKLNQFGVACAVALLFAIGADAAPVTAREAESVSRAFAARRNALGACLGTEVERVVAHKTSNGATFFTVKMYGSGTVITSGDTELNPVVAFVPGDADLAKIDRTSPLGALLNGDLSAQKEALDRQSVAPLVERSVMAIAEKSAGNREKWEALLSEDEARHWTLYALERAAMIGGESGIGDLRVGALVETTWSQSGGGEDYFTPNNYVCGCVATAMAQIMRYHKWPKSEVAQFTEMCAVDGRMMPKTAIGGRYDWDNMPLRGGVTRVQKEAVGTLTYDCGVSVGMSWAADGSGASTPNVAGALRGHFGYSSALAAVNSRGLDVSDAGLGRLMFACFDAGYPVQLGISDHGRDGHSVVADGYGFVNGLSYVHINMGWGGVADAWYHLPEIEYRATQGGGSYTADTVHVCVYNIFPEEAGAVLSGRVLDDEGEPLAGAAVAVSRDGVTLANLATSARGVWAVVLPAGTYDVAARSAAGNKEGLETGVVLGTDNAWGNDIMVTAPSVRIGPVEFSSLDAALAAAKDGDVLEVFDQSELRSMCTVAASCTIVATGGDPLSKKVRARKGAGLSVAADVRLSLKNVAFAGVEPVVIDVASGGVLSVAGGVVVDRIVTHSDDAIRLAAPIEHPLAVLPWRKGGGEPFGWCDDPAAASTANLFLNVANDSMGGRVEGSRLVWDGVPVPDEATVVRLEQDGVGTNFRSFETLLPCVSNDAVIVVKKPCSLKSRLTVGRRLLIGGEAENPVVVSYDGIEAGFNIVEGGSLTLANVTFSGFRGDAFLGVNGGDLRLEKGATLTDLAGTNGQYGAVCVRGGALTMRPGARILNCMSAGSGGGITAMGGRVSLEGGLIAGCQANRYGGGVCAYTDYAEVSLSGDIAITNNVVYGQGPEDVWVSDGGNHPLRVAAPLSAGPLSIGVTCSGDNAVGGKFAAYDPAALSPDAAKTSAKAFFCTNPDDAEIRLTGAAENGDIRWAVRTDELADDELDRAVIRLVYPDGTTNCYADVAQAFANVKGPCTAEPLGAYLTFDEDVEISDEVVLTSDGSPFVPILQRLDDAVVRVRKGGSLTLRNIILLAYEDSDLPLVSVSGGELTLDAGASLAGARKDGAFSPQARSASAVAVYDGGVFTMKSGSLISDCENLSVDSVRNIQSGAGGGVLIDGGSTAYFLGGTIDECRSSLGGGVCVCNKSTAYVSGDFTVTGNWSVQTLQRNNILVEDSCRLILAGSLEKSTGLGMTAGYQLTRDTNLVATVANWSSGQDLQSLTNSAAQFFKDDDVRVRGFLVTNTTDTALVVWSTAIGADGRYVFEADGKEPVVYHAAGEVPVIDPEPPAPPTPAYATPDPIAFQSIVVGEAAVTLKLTNAVTWCNYRLFATNSLEGGFAVTNASGDFIVMPVTNFQWTSSEKEIELVLPRADGQMFWKATAEEGEVP